MRFLRVSDVNVLIKPVNGRKTVRVHNNRLKPCYYHPVTVEENMSPEERRVPLKSGKIKTRKYD